MNTFYAVCLIAVCFHLLAVPAVIWAVKTRQGRESDQEAYRTVQGRAPRAVTTASHPPISRLRMGLFFGLIITMLLLMCSAQVYLAVAASRAPSAKQATY